MRPASPHTRGANASPTAARPPPATSSILYDTTAAAAPLPYTLLPSNPHTLPLRYPVAVWSAPPAHHIAAIASYSPPTSTTGTRYVYTASVEGHMVQWEPLPSKQQVQPTAASPTASSPPYPTISPSLSFRPRFLSFRHGSASITALCCVPYLSSFLVCAATSEGFLSVWSPSGQCLGSSFALPFHATALLPLHSLPSYMSSASYVMAVSSHSPYLYLYSLPSIHPVLLLGHEADGSGIVGLCSVTKRARNRTGEEKDGSSSPTGASSAVEEREMVCSVSASGLITVWDIHNKLKRQRDKRATYPFFSFSTFQSSVLSSSPSASLAPLSIIPATVALCLVLTSTSVAVVSTLSLSVLCLVSLVDRGWGVGDEVELIGMECGSVVQSIDSSVLQLVLTTSTRVVLIVRLTCRFERKRRKDGKVDERCECDTSLDAVIPLDHHKRNRPSQPSHSPTTTAGVLLPASNASCVRVVDEHLVVGHDGGEVTVYGLPSLSAVSPASAAVLLPSFYTCLAFAFPHLSLASLLSPAVTCSHLFLSSSPPFLYHCVGHADGRLHVSSLTSESSSATDIDFTVAAHSSAIRCMLDVEVRGFAGCQRLLATGGDDGSVCIWKIEERRCRARFYASSAVVALMQLTSSPTASPPSSNSSSAFAFPVTSSTAAASWTLPCLLFVVCACHTIRIYSLVEFALVSILPAHSSPPVSLSLPSTSADLLLVLTTSGSLYLWSMSAGQLLGVVEGQQHRAGDDKGGMEYWLERRGGGRAGDVGASELAMACARARDELKAKRDAERDRKRLNGRRTSTISASTSNSAFASLSSSPFLLSALSALSSSSPLTLPSLTSIPLSPSLRTQQTELIQLLSILFPSAPLQALERERREVQVDSSDEEKESNMRQREREREREEERVEAARERAKAIDRDHLLDQQKAQSEAEENEERRRDTAGIPVPPAIDVLNWATCSSSDCSLSASSCVSVAVLDVPALVEQLQASHPHPTDEQQEETDNSAFTHLRSFLSLLFDWDGKGNIDSLLHDELHLPQPRPSRSFAHLSCNDSAISVLFPSHAYSYRRWQVGEEWSGLHALSVSSLCLVLLSPSPSSSHSSLSPSAAAAKLLSYYITIISDSPKHYPPSLIQLLSYTLHSSFLVSTASRLLLQHYLTGLPLHTASALSTTWGDYFDYPLIMDGIWGDWDEKDRVVTDSGREMDDTAVSERELLVAQLLTVVGVRELDAKKRKRRQQQLLSDNERFAPFSPLASSSPSAPLTEFEAKSQYITHTLLRVIARPLSSLSVSLQQQQMTTLACDLLCSALSFLRIHISAPLPLLRHLLLLSVSCTSQTVVASSSRLLMECGRLAPSFYIECMGREALNSLSPSTLRQSSISSLSTLLRTHPLPLSRSLPSSVHTIIRCLDPASPQLRKTMLNVTTAALYALVTLYPACSFHQQSQRYAVGCCGKDGSGGVILVYDLRTATVWRVLEGHTSDVHAVLFSRDEAGDRLVSYSATEGSGVVRVWNTEQGGWLGGLIGMSGKCVRTVKLDRVDVSGVLRRERDVAREKARLALEDEKREEKRREERKTRKRAPARQLNVQPTLYVNGLDLLSSSPHSFFTSYSPSSSSSTRHLATDSPASASLNPGTPTALAARTPPTVPSTAARLPPPPILLPTTSSSSTSSTSSNGKLTPSPSPLSTAAPGDMNPPPLTLYAEGELDVEEEVEGMGPSIGIATYHALPGAVISGGGVAGSAGGSGAAVTRAMQRRLLGVKLSWLNDKAVRLVREDGSVKDVQV